MHKLLNECALSRATDYNLTTVLHFLMKVAMLYMSTILFLSIEHTQTSTKTNKGFV